MAIPWTNDDAFEFARIIPEGLEAERALDMVYDAPTLADHHRSCIQVHRRTRLLDSETDMNNSDDTDTSPAEYWAGHYLLSLRNAPKNPFSVGWRIGRGSSKHPEDDTRGVDLLLIRPRCKSQGVAAVHARIQFNRLSGVLMLMGVQDDKPVSYTAHDSATPTFLASGQGHVLYQNTNLFSLGSLRYRLVFRTFTDTEYASFVGERNNLLAGSGLPPPHPGLSAVPRPQDVKRSSTVTHGSLAAGKFGWVSAAVEVQSGKPLVVKEQRATNQHGLRSILHEIEIGGAFKENQGLLPTLSAWCEHDRHDVSVCGKLPDLIFSTSPLAITDFNNHIWDQQPLTQTLEFFRGPLLGLVTLHHAGYIHRDVHGGNMLIIAHDPPRAVLGDFGKTIKAKSDNYECLGPKHTCAPEVDGETMYSNKIDIWSFGFCIFDVIFRQYQRESLTSGKKTTDIWHGGVSECLHQYSLKGNLENQTANLLSGMLHRNPAQRFSAAEALQHPCFTQQPDIPPQAQQRSLLHRQTLWSDRLVSSEEMTSESSGPEVKGASVQWVSLRRRFDQPKQMYRPMKH